MIAVGSIIIASVDIVVLNGTLRARGRINFPLLTRSSFGFWFSYSYVDVGQPDGPVDVRAQHRGVRQLPMRMHTKCSRQYVSPQIICKGTAMRGFNVKRSTTKYPPSTRTGSDDTASSPPTLPTLP